MRNARCVCAAVLFLVGCPIAYSQKSDPDINKYLSMIDTGQAEAVRGELPSLMTTYPNNPGVLYIQAVLTRDGAEAVRIYQSIVDNFPKSMWADDALYKVYQFYYALGLYRTAEMKMAQLKKNYPNSTFAVKGADVETKGLADEKEEPVPPSLDTLGSAPDTSSPAPPRVRQPEVFPPRQTGSQGQFALQVGAYSSLVNAEKQKVFFENLKFPVEVITKVKNARSLYIVMIGNFGSYDAAKAKGGELKRKYNIDSIVLAR